MSDITKVGGVTWAAPGDDIVSSDAVTGFINDANNERVTNSIGDLLNVVRGRSNRQFISSTPASGMRLAKTPPALNTMKTSNSEPLLNETGQSSIDMLQKGKVKKRMQVSALRRAPPGVSYSITERPANRSEISKLENELEERISAVLYTEITDLHNLETGNIYQPDRDAMMICRDKIIKELIITTDELLKEEWTDKLIRCECLRETCDDVSKKLCDMLSVSSAELGNVLRKLRYTYMQSFEQMRISWEYLRSEYLANKSELFETRDSMALLRADLNEKDGDIKQLVDKEVSLIKSALEREKQDLKEQVDQSYVQIDQLSESLRTMNGIFKTMQGDFTASKTQDLNLTCQRLEKENAELLAENFQYEKTKEDLRILESKFRSNDMELRQREQELISLRNQLNRREEAIATLMEKEALRDAEIEKLQKSIVAKEEGEEKMEYEEAATSVLCIKCKKGLDDLTHIRAAILGDGSAAEGQKVQCESFRILLPNLKGRRPNRSNEWLRNCMRGILLSKMRDNISLVGIKGDVTSFPQYVYSWFERNTEGLQGTALATAYSAADEDRWGAYYGIKTLAKEDPEAVIFWTLLDESQGQDALHYVCHCLSIVLSIGGSDLWKQLGEVMNKSGNINITENVKERVRNHIWIDIGAAIDATKMILVRAMKSHIVETIEAIDALRVIPEIEDPEIKEEEQNGDDMEVLEANEMIIPVIEEKKEANDDIDAKAKLILEATHIDLFVWLRIMLQKLQAEQIHRTAAIRLMFESASVGALTPQLPNSDGSTGSQVEFPQFQSICKTLFPFVSTTEAALFFARAYEDGKKKVTADVFMKIADRYGLFTKALRLATLPLLERHAPNWHLLPINSKESGVNEEKTSEAKEEVPPITEGEIPQEADAEPKPTLVEVAESMEKVSIDTEKQRMEELLSSETLLRVKLGSLVHRRMQAIKPQLMNLIESAPEKWKALILEEMDGVNYSLNECFLKMKKKFDDGSEAEKYRSRYYIDGVQPFVKYRKLLSLSLLVKTLIDNPLLPTELFAGRHRNMLPNLNLGINQAEKLLSCLEEGLLIGSDAPANYQISKYYRYETARKNIAARKIQITCKYWMKRPQIIPSPLRNYIKPGYVRGVGSVKLKKREILNDAWWGQAVAAEIFAFKLMYDRKAIKLGVPVSNLSEAIAAFHYVKWGSIDVAERMIQDLCKCVQIYAEFNPRLRVFAALLGIGKFEEATVASMFLTPQAVSLYLDLLLTIHAEIHTIFLKSIETMDQQGDQEESNNVDANPVRRKSKSKSKPQEDDIMSGGLSITGSSAGTEKPSNSRRESFDGSQDVKSSTPKINDNVKAIYLNGIDSLFPSTGNPFNRVDKQDTWCIDINVLVSAVRRWSCSQGIYENEPFVDVTEKLQLNEDGGADVDEFLFIVMNQWAKLTAWYLKRSSARAIWYQKNGPQAKSLVPNDSGKPSKYALTTQYLSTFVESLYRPQEGKKVSDHIAHGIIFMRNLKLEANNSISQNFSSFPNDVMLDPATDSKKTSSVVKFSNVLRECMLWELNTCNFSESNSVTGNAIDRNNFVSNIHSGANPYLTLQILRMSYGMYKEPIKKMMEDAMEKYKQPSPLFKSVEKQNGDIGKLIKAADKYLNKLPNPEKVNKTVPDVDYTKVKRASLIIRELFSVASEFAVSIGTEFPTDNAESQSIKLITASTAFNITTRSQPL